MTVSGSPNPLQRPDRKVDEFLRPPAAPPIKAITAFGLFTAIVGLGGFAVWTSIAPLASAAIATGTIVVDSSRKTVQHVDGGAIGELLVRDGDRVQEGQILVRLDNVEAQSLHDLIEGRVLSLWAQEVRLTAERNGASRLAFPAQLEALRGKRPDVAEIVDGQQKIFDSGRIAYQGQIDVLGKRTAQLKAQEAGLLAQLVSTSSQSSLIHSELQDVRALHSRGLERKPRLLALERNAAKLKGDEGEFSNRIAQIRESATSNEFEILNLDRARVEKAAVEQRDVQSRLAEARERLAEARVKLRRREVVAPQAGTVLNLRYHNVGAVVGPASKILDIVPAEDKLIVEARVKPTDIDSVRAGLAATIAFTAFKSRTTPQIEGRVVNVSADALSEERSGSAYFVARIELDSNQLTKFPELKPIPGMPVEAFIETGERTLLAYMVQPLTDSFRRAFREQ